MRILGISAFYHDSAATLIVDGRIVAAAQEERFTRLKADARFPEFAIRYCLSEAGIELKDVDFIAFYDKPFLKFERLLETYLSYAPRGFKSFITAMPIWLREKLFQNSLICGKLKAIGGAHDWAGKLLFCEHHLSHAASAFYASPFEDAAVITMDGVGEWATTSVAVGHGGDLRITKEIHFPHSLGLLYSAFTYYTGFKVNSGEYKVMGLAPYGEPRFTQTILDNLIDVKDDGSFRLNMDYFDFASGLRMTNERFDQLFGGPPRKPEVWLVQRDMDLAASIQAALEHVVIKLTRAVAAETGLSKLCMAGGVALNCVANGRVLRDGKFNEVWVQPASGDAGGSLGAALAAYYGMCGMPRAVEAGKDMMQGSYLGPSFDDTDIQRRLTEAGARFTQHDPAEIVERTADALASEKAVGWFQGRMEFGPRALGARSILGDARSPTMQSLLNLKVKYRESFRPFAPSVLREDVAEWFELDADSPYMLLVADVVGCKRRQMTNEENTLFGIEKLNIPRSDIPAVTHIDYSARIQTVHKDTNPLYHALISAFKARTGCPVVVNTSFNVRGEPLVCTPEEAFRCFMGTEIEVLVVGGCYLRKEDQDPALKTRYEGGFELD